jgi:hypothetical protein
MEWKSPPMPRQDPHSFQVTRIVAAHGNASKNSSIRLHPMITIADLSRRVKELFAAFSICRDFTDPSDSL